MAVAFGPVWLAARACMALLTWSINGPFSCYSWLGLEALGLLTVARQGMEQLSSILGNQLDPFCGRAVINLLIVGGFEATSRGLVSLSSSAHGRTRTGWALQAVGGNVNPMGC